MRLYVIRHAIAEDRNLWIRSGKSDALRPLNKKGILKFTEVVECLSLFIPTIKTIYSSQLTRSVQTAEILHGHFPKSKLHIVSDLNPGVSINKFLRELKKHKTNDRVAIVGHQPDLSFLLNTLLKTGDESFFEFKKGGICCLEISAKQVVMVWMMNATQLIAIKNTQNKILLQELIESRSSV